MCIKLKVTHDGSYNTGVAGGRRLRMGALGRRQLQLLIGAAR
jgi:hypothetical protein